MKLITEMYDDFQILTEGTNGKDLKIQGVFMQAETKNRNGVLSTPPLIDNLLPGITRDCVVDIVKNALGFDVEERSIPRSELYLADEIFLTGTAAHVQGVGSVDNHEIGDGQMGPLTRQIQSLYFDIVTGRNIKYSHWCTKA